ncbi:MAG: PDDEXK nuclease domain-containing protein, partial [Patescibacteria group bacterium]
KDIALLINGLKTLIRKAKYNAVYAVNAEMLRVYFEIGRRIVEEEQKGHKRAEYGKKLIETLSFELTKEFRRGFSETALKNMRIFYLVYQHKISQSLTDELYKLSWTHYCELIKIQEENKRNYFEKYAIAENLSVRDLKRQIYSLHYEWLLMSKDKKALLAFDKKGNIPSTSEELIKDPYVLEFLELEEKNVYTEKELETRILNELQKFLLELGQGFSFVARQKRITIDNEHFYIDLLFYNIYLKCYVVVELKTTKFRHEHAGQMNFYLNYVKERLNKPEDNEPIGILLCTDKDTVYVNFAAHLPYKLFVSQYRLHLPNKKELENKVRKFLA